MKTFTARALIVLLTIAIAMSTLFAACAQAYTPAADVGLATAMPREIPKDPDDPRNFNFWKNAQEKARDVIIGIGKSFVPFGDTIVNLTKPGNTYPDTVKTVFDLTADGVSFLVPFAKPFVAVNKGLAHMVIDWFR